MIALDPCFGRGDGAARWCRRSAARHLELHVDIPSRRMGVGADLLMRLAGETRELGLRQALVFDLKLDGEAEAAAVARADRHGTGDPRLGRILLLLLGDEIERAAEAGGIAG